MSVETNPPVGDANVSDEVQPARDDGVTLIAVYHFLLGGFCLLITVLIAIPTLITGIIGIMQDPEVFVATLILAILGLVTMALCLLLLIVGYGLWTGRQWGRSAAIALALLSLFFFPIGTIAGAGVLWYMLKPEVAAKFS